MNVFEEIHRTIMTVPDTIDELAILAKDARGLSKDERELIRRTAEELRECYRYIGCLQADFQEATARGIAAREQCSELRHKLDALENKALSNTKPESTPSAITWTTLVAGSVQLNGPIYGKAFGL